MRKFLVFVSALIVFASVQKMSGDETNEWFPIFREPPISEKFASNITYWSNVVDLVTQENVATDGQQDQYFVVYIPQHPDGGTILKIEKMVPSGMIVAWGSVKVTDVCNTNAKPFFVSFEYNGKESGGEFSLYGQKFVICIRFLEEWWFPSYRLTWGDNCGIGFVGDISDDMSSTIVTDKPTVSALGMVVMTGITDVPDGTYVVVASPDEKYTLQSTTDFKTWQNEPLPFYIKGYVGFHYFPLPTNGVCRFWRTVYTPAE